MTKGKDLKLGPVTLSTKLNSMEAIKALPDAKAPSFKINNEEITQERDYTTGLDEIAKGIS